MGSPSYSVPSEIVEAILLKLPVRSLIRFKAVSKHFQSLISSTRFISDHYQNSKAKPSMIFRSCQRFSVCSNPINMPALQLLDRRPYVQKMELVGSANGIVCIREFYRGDTKFTLWNPATNQCRYEIPCPRYDSEIIVGFGYHAGIEDYKLLVMPRDPFEDNPQVLQVKSDTWKEIKPCIGLEQPINYRCCSAVVVSGVWYQVRDMDSGPSILSFDLKDDSLALIEPPFFRGEIKIGVALGMRDQKLCSFAMGIERRCCGWMMVEKASWIEMFTIDLCSKVDCSLRLRSTWQSTWLMMENITSYYLFDTSQGSDSLNPRYKVPKTYGYFHVSEFYDFVESLVSPIFLEI